METTPEREVTSETPVPATEPAVAMNHGEAMPQAESAQTIVPETAPFYKNKQLLISVVVAVLILAGAGYYVYGARFTQGATVAVVNGEKVYQNELDESIKLIEETAAQQGMDTTLAENQTEIHNQALEVLINNKLLITAAKDAGVEVTDEEIQAKYAELVEQLGGEELLKTKLAEVGLTEEKLLSNIEERVLADKYIESSTDIKNLVVSDAEIAAFFKEIDTGATELPPLEQIRPQIEAQILNQKQQEIVTTLLAKLRSEGTVDIRI